MSWRKRWLLFAGSLLLGASPGYAQTPNSTEPPPASIKLQAGDTGLSKNPVLKPESKGANGVAQSINLSSVTGAVSDMAGHKVQDAHAVLSKVGEEHKRYQTESSAEGTFSFNNIEPGDWTLTVSAKDMLSHTTEVTLAAGNTSSLKIALEDVEPVDVLRVTGKRTLIHPEKIGSETNLDHPMIFQYKTGNDLRDLITSTPGVMNDSYGNIITRGEHNAINYELDGAVLPEAAGVLQQSQLVSPRSLQSMTVDIGGYEAQDGGGPLGAVAHLKSLPIASKPTFNIGQQIGGPLAGSIYYNSSGAFSQKNSFWNKLRFESSGSVQGSSYRLAPPVKDYVSNDGVDINILSKLEYLASERDIVRLTAAINESYTQVPTAGFSKAAGVNAHQHDGQDYVMLSYIHRFQRYLDECNLHVINSFYYEHYKSSLAFDPTPDFNNGQPLQSIAAIARRFNYIFSAQGNVLKTINREHHLKAGFLSEVRPVHTFYNATYYNADLIGSLNGTTSAPFGAVVSPFTNAPGGPQFQGSIGKFSGFRYLQSAFFQDKYTPQNGFWKRLTLDGGVRFDMQHSVYGNTLPLAETIATIPGVQPFSLQPYQTQRITDAQASGRYGAAFVLAKNTVWRASYSDLFMPNPVDYFVVPYPVIGVNPNAGIYDGTPRPLHATRGQLVDTSIERQFSPRLVLRTNLFFKHLQNFGDSGVVGNLPIYNRLTNSAQKASGVETRLDYKPRRDGYGFNGFLSNTIQVAYLESTRTPSGGFYATPLPPFMLFPDHDRRLSNVAGIGYKSHANWYTLFQAQVLSGLQDERDPTVVGPHPQRTPIITDLGLTLGYQTPQALIKGHRYLPKSFDLRIDNMLNQRLPVNLGSPFQGTRFNLPLRILVGCAWQFGKEQGKLSSAGSPQI